MFGSLKCSTLSAAMYQCKASNQLGSTFSTAQLKIVSLKPVFKQRMDKDMFASVGNNYTIACDPEAVPFPEFQWKRNNMPITLGGKFRILPNGHLFINPVNLTDGYVRAQQTIECSCESLIF